MSFLTKVDGKCRRSTVLRYCAEELRWNGGQSIKNCLVIKPLGRGLGGSSARLMMVAIIAALLPLRIGRSF